MKNKVMQKLTATIIMLIVATVMIAAVSYAWFVQSTAPVVEGIKISIGGGTTILIAPNRTITENGEQYHYPGEFRSTLDFDMYEEYDYLNHVDGLMPVSTADGLHWFLPNYYTGTDEEVINGTASAGQVKPIEEFKLDMDLEYANLCGDDRSYSGGYVYLDFWVVAPGADYDLRLSRGDDGSGSFLVELMQPIKSNGAYVLQETFGSVATSARVGFLVDHNVIADETVLQHYRNSVEYISDYSTLRGSYAEPGEGIYYSSQYLFTIYEPNADIHPIKGNGTYIPTNPVSWQSGTPVAASISDIVTVQLQSKWQTGPSGTSLVEETFQAATAGKTLDEAQLYQWFYEQQIGDRLQLYIENGNFIRETAVLYEAAASGTVNVDTLEVSGATDDIIIAHLEKNVPQRIRMFVWLEGQDVDCISGADDVVFALNIELAGSHTTYGKASSNEER